MELQFLTNFDTEILIQYLFTETKGYIEIVSSVFLIFLTTLTLIKMTDWMALRIFSCNNKTPSFLSLVLIIQFFEGRSRHAVTLIVMKLFDIHQTLKITSLGNKNFRSLQTFFYLLGNTSH